MILAPTLTLSAGSGAAIVRPTFSRDFAGEKSLNNGTGPAITFTRASNATFFDASGVLQTAANDAPRFDHDPATGASRGLLIEEARTNSIPNSQMSGAVTGTQGTVPTNWNISTHVSQGLNRTITTGTANGLSYIDVAYSGTTNASFNIFFDPQSTNAGYVAANGQSWTGSVYLALIAGSIPSGATLDLVVRGRDSGGTSTSDQTLINPSLTGTLARYSATRTFTSASTTRVTIDIRVTNIPTTTAVDFTLRIAAPQLEQGAFATSYIPTTTAAATRSADSAIVTPISGFYNQSEGTLFADFSRYQTAAVANFLHFTGTSPNQIVLETNATPPSTLQRFLVETSAGAQANIAFSGVVANTVYRMIGAYAANSFQAAQSGTLGTEDTGGALPTVSQMTIGAGKYGTDALFKVLNGHIRKVAYYPKRLSNTLLQQLTT
jgi:hypothetical protein